jgi:hypothetical protein
MKRYRHPIAVHQYYVKRPFKASINVGGIARETPQRPDVQGGAI